MSFDPAQPDHTGRDVWSSHPQVPHEQSADSDTGPSSAPERPRPRWPWVAFAVVAVILSLAALLGVSLLVSYRSEQAAAEAAERDAAKASAAEAKAIATCREEIGDFVEAVLDTSSRAEVGITQADLSKAVGDASVLRNRIDTSKLTPVCDSAFRAADKAISIYALSASTWDDCIWDDLCDPDVDFDNSDWSVAQETAKEAYEAMRTGRSAESVNS